MVTLAPVITARLWSLIVPTRVALTACPMTGEDNPNSIAPSRTATPSCHNLNRAVVAGAANSSVRIVRDLFWLQIQEKDEDNLDSFFMTSPQFERLQPRLAEDTWNWFHTLTDRKRHVKPDSHETNILHRFSCFLPTLQIRQSAAGIPLSVSCVK